MMLAALGLGLTLWTQDTLKGVVVENSNGYRVISGSVGTTELKIYLPDDMRQGDTISGTVLEVNGGSLKASDRFRVASVAGPKKPIVAGPGGVVTWLLTDQQGNGFGSFQTRTKVDLGAPLPSGYRASAVVARGTPIRISGPFDGDSSNTKARMGGVELPVIAESPRQAYVMPPSIATGKFSFTVQEGSEPRVACVTRVVIPLFSIQDPLIKVGETTQANVGLLGLSDLQDGTIPMLLTNNNPQIAQLKGGNTQVVEVSKSKLDENGAFRTQVPVTAMGAGRYTLTLQTAMMSSSGEEEEDREPMTIKVTGPSKVKAGETASYRATAYPAAASLVLVRFVYVSLGGISRLLGTDIDPSDGWSASLDAKLVPEGPGFVYVLGVGEQEQTAQDHMRISVGGEAGSSTNFGNKDIQSSYDKFAKTLVTIQGATILAALGQADAYESAIDQWNKTAIDKKREAQDEFKKAVDSASVGRVLENLDKELEALIATAFPEMQRLIREMEESKGKPGQRDELKKQADALSQDAKRCKENCDALEKALERARQDQRDLEQQMKDLASEVEKTFKADGWTGRASFDPKAGIIRWGFVSDGGGNHEINNYGSVANKKISEARKQKRDLAKKLADKKKEIEDLENKVKGCKEHCADMEKAAQNAQQAAESAQTAAVKDAEIEKLCHEIREILGRIRRFLANHPEEEAKLDPYFQAMTVICPKTQQELEDYVKQIRSFIEAKKKVEEQAKSDAHQHRKNAKSAWDAADAAQGIADQLARQQGEAEDKAREFEAQRKKEQAEAERKARDAAEKANKAKQEQDRKDAEARGQAFLDWLKDMMARGLISSDGQKLIEDLQSSLGAGLDISTSLADGFGTALNQWMMGGSSGQMSSAGVAQALTGLAATIYYWWIEAEMRGALDRIKEKLEPRRLQELLVTIDQNFKGQPFGRVDIPGKGGESYFFMRKGNLILIFNAERGKGLSVCYAGRADGK